MFCFSCWYTIIRCFVSAVGTQLYGVLYLLLVHNYTVFCMVHNYTVFCICAETCFYGSFDGMITCFDSGTGKSNHNFDIHFKLILSIWHWIPLLKNVLFRLINTHYIWYHIYFMATLKANSIMQYSAHQQRMINFRDNDIPKTNDLQYVFITIDDMSLYEILKFSFILLVL